MLYQKIAELLADQAITWNTTDGDIVPTDSDVERAVDGLIKYLNTHPKAASIETAGLVVVRNGPVFDIYVNVATVQ